MPYRSKQLTKGFQGESITILGRKFKLKLLDEPSLKPSVILSPRKIYISTPTSTRYREAFINWSRDVLKDYIEKKASRIAFRHGLRYKKVTVKSQKSRWGSCSSNKNLNFNWRLVFAPVEVLDYVIVHEMAHLKIMNHSNDFWSVVGRIMPDYKKAMKWLEKNGYELF